jgi:hypothetical protein
MMNFKIKNVMKNILIYVFCLVCSVATAQTSIENILRRYKNDEGVINLNFDGNSIKKMIQTKEKIKSEISVVDVIVFEKKANLSASDITKINTLLTRDKFELLVDSKSKDGKAKVYAVDAGPHLTQIYAQVSGNGMTAYMIIKGKIIFEELSKLGLDFDKSLGMEILNGLN